MRKSDGARKTIVFLAPVAFRTVPLPDLSGAAHRGDGSQGMIAARIEEAQPDDIHIATEGPLGLITRATAGREAGPSPPAITRAFPEYVSARLPVPGAGATR